MRSSVYHRAQLLHAQLLRRPHHLARSIILAGLMTLPAALVVRGYPHFAAASPGSNSQRATSATAASCAQADVQAAIDQAQDGDTVAVPAGSCAWGGAIRLFNDRGVTLICATQSSCVIDLITTGSGIYFGGIAGNNDRLYRISGFRFQNAPAQSGVIRFDGDVASTLSRFRIDHNVFENFGYNVTAIRLGQIAAAGKYYGVIDHNVFSGANNMMGLIYLGPGDPDLWAASVRGSAQNVFVEDNLFDFSAATNLGLGCVDAWKAAALVFRHNDVKNCLVAAHGVTHDTTVNFEFYSNVLRRTASSGDWEDGTRLFHHQGSGEMFLWGNTFHAIGPLSSGAIGITHYRSATPADAGYGANLGRCNGTNARDGNRSGQLGYPCWMQPGRAPAGGSPGYGVLSPIYGWMNVDGATGAKVDITIENPWAATSPGVDDHIKPERDFYDAVSGAAQTTRTSPFSGSSGVGFGTLANRPTTCTTNSAELGGGVGYWATDTNTLYRCAAANTWATHYQPYVYPHPLVQSPSLAARVYVPLARRP